MAIRILIVDDHAVVRDGLRLILSAQVGMEIVGEAGNGLAAIEQAAALRPDVVVLDVAMPGISGIEAAREIARVSPSSRVLILSMLQTREHVARAIAAGARGYVLKESAGVEVVAAVSAVAAGRTWFGRGVEPPGPGEKVVTDPLALLSRREREVLQYVAEGHTSADIAARLSLSPKSVETYRSRLMRKLGTANVAALVRFALEHGVLPKT